MKRLMIVLIATLLLTPSFHINTFAAQEKREEDGKYSTKDEVIYATLTAHGDRDEIYVVNTFDVVKAGKIIDYGTYSSVKNLTDLTDIEQVKDKVQFTAEEGKFYYQGNMNEEDLPWNISIFYSLDGEKVDPEQLAGKDGKVKIRVETFANKSVDPVFFENYVLQISLTLDSNRFTNIKAEDGTIANAGKNKQVSFNVLPEKEEEFIVEADVEDFEFEGIEITGIHSTLNIDAPDTDDMTGDMKTLREAIADINAGVGELKNGISELSSGAESLREGSGKFKTGLSDLDGSSSELVSGSKKINQSLATMSSYLKEVGKLDLNEFNQLVEGLSLTSNGFREMATEMATLRSGYADAYDALDASMQAIPTYDISEKDVEDLYNSGADPQIVDQLVKTYKAAQTAKGTYNQVKQAFDAVDTALKEVIDSLNEMADSIDANMKNLPSLGDSDILNELTQLQEGIEEFSKSYNVFHSGLVAYTDGVSELSRSYADLHNGVGELADGTKKLKDGATELHDGTTKLEQSTSNLPEQMTEEIDRMIAEYDLSDFESVSFVSPENDKINVVQFVMKTESIKAEDSEETEEVVEEEKGFWARFKELFQ